jgi:hypothetical protein
MLPAMEKSDGSRKLDAMLRHLGGGQDLREFPGTMSEKLALTRTADKRGLIAWRKGARRYELTPIGWSKLTPRRYFGLASLMVSAAIGATVAVAVAVLSLPADDSHRSVRRQPAASVSLQTSIAAPTSHSVDVGARRPAPPQPAKASQDAPPAVAHDFGPSAAPGNSIEAPQVAEQPALEQPGGVTARNVVKHAAAKKSHYKRVRAAAKKPHHKMARTLWRRTWGFANRWPDQRYAVNARMLW